MSRLFHARKASTVLDQAFDGGSCMKRRCCEAPDHELVAVFKGEGSKVLERQPRVVSCMLRMGKPCIWLAA